ncbi:MAG: hypothetical protein IIB77_07885, partial [Proteobacteria bacterium]|nr:hypothetical protein [Pseudomonadota bacterium]
MHKPLRTDRTFSHRGNILASAMVCGMLISGGVLAQESKFDLEIEAGVGYSDNFIRAENSVANPDIEEYLYKAGLI